MKTVKSGFSGNIQYMHTPASTDKIKRNFPNQYHPSSAQQGNIAQLYIDISTSYSDTSTLDTSTHKCWKNHHLQMTGNWLGCSETTQEPP